MDWPASHNDAAQTEATPDEMLAVLNDPARLKTLEDSGLLDTPPEAAFDRLTRLTRRILKTPVALVSLVDHNRQFFKSGSGQASGNNLPHETPLDASFCKHAVASGHPLVVADAREHALVRENLAIESLGVIAYAGVPLITTDGHSLGSFCAIDTSPRDWTPDEIAILQDLAAMALTEIELRLAARKLRESVAELQRAEAQHDSLVSMIVHDLRTPLTSYLSGVMALNSLGELNEFQREAIRIAISGGHSMQRMIDDLLQIARMEAVLYGTAKLSCESIDAKVLTNKVLDQITQLATKNELELRVEIAPDMPVLHIAVDLIERVLVNLLGNALKFTPSPGFVALKAEVLNTTEDSCSRLIHFSVQDSGPGIAPDDYEKIFQLFGQSAARQSGHKLSTGLGLTFCKLVVEAHGGVIWVESEEGKGSTFHFTLPQND